MTAAPTMRLVLVEWQDSHANAGWQNIDLTTVEDRALVCHSAGWLMFEGDNVIVIAPHVNQAEPGISLQASGAMTIPTRCVISIRNLEPFDAK